MPGPWYVYLLECADGSMYCGITSDVERRLAQHNGCLAGGARYTHGRRPVRLLGARACACRTEALRLEIAVKASRKEKKLGTLLHGAIHADA